MTSKRDIEKRLERLTDDEDDYPLLSFAEFIAHAEDDTLDPVDQDRGLYRVDGELKQTPQNLSLSAEDGDD